MRRYRTLSIDRRPDVLIAQLNRPDRLNAMNFQMFEEFTALQDEAEADKDVRVLVVTGVGRAFSAGLDLDAAATLPRMSSTEMLRRQESWARSITGFRHMTKPVVAAVNGAAAGAGLGLALAADIRIASTTARFNAAFVRIGLSGGDVGTSWALPRVVGLGRAYDMLLTGRFVEADEALRIGLVTSVVPNEELIPAAVATAQLISQNSPFGMTLTKQVVQQNIDAPSLEAALALENRNQVLATRTADMERALVAFLDKTTPTYTGD